MTEQDAAPLLVRADALEAATDLARGRLDGDIVENAVATAARIRARLRHGTDRTVVAVVGPTGSGKSTLFNALVGSEVSTAGVLRPTTTEAHAALWGGDEPSLLRWLEIPRRHLVHDGDPSLEGLVLVDLPDVDSIQIVNRQEAERLIEVVDCMLWVVDPQKYADEAVHDQHLAPLAGHSDVLRFALTKTDLVPGDELADVVADFEARLRADGIDDPVVWAVSVSTPDDSGYARLVDGLRTLVADRSALVARLDADLSAAAAGLVSGDGGGDVSVDRLRDAAVAGMAEAVHIDVVTEGVASHHRRLAARATGWAPRQWLARRRPSPATELIRADGVDRVRVEAALRDAAEAGAADLAPPWNSIIRKDLMARTDDASSALRSRAVGVVSHLGKPPRWWTGAAWIQHLLLGAAALGAMWLLFAAAVEASYLSSDAFIPRVGNFPIPTALFFGGIILGLVLALLCRLPAAIGARRRARSARRQLTEQVGEVVDNEVIGPLRHVLDDRAELSRLAAVVAGDTLV